MLVFAIVVSPPLLLSEGHAQQPQQLLGKTCGVFGEPAGVTGAAGLKKLCEQGVLGENDTVVSVVTGNGLKDVANAIAFCGEPMSLPNDLDLLVAEFDKRGIDTK